MSLSLQTEWISDAPLDVAKARARFRGGKYSNLQVDEFLNSLQKHTLIVRMATAALAAQVAKETANFRYGNQVRADQFNFAGIGAINSGGAGQSFATIDDGVKGLIAHHGNYRWGEFENWPEHWRDYKPYAVRNTEVVGLRINGRKVAGTVRKIGDFVNGVWAWSENKPIGTLENGYATGIVLIANELLATGVDPMSLRQFPSPNFGYPRGEIGRSGHKVQAVVIHISVGSIGSMRHWFANPDSGASSNLGVPRTGLPADQYVRFNASPWTNGDVKKYDQSIPWLRATIEAGINVNEVTETIECEGYPNEPWPEAQYQGVLSLVRERLKANNLAPSKHTVIGHFQVNGIDKVNCPGPNFPWNRLYHDLKVIPNIGPKTLSIILSDTYELGRAAMAGAGLPDPFGLKLYEATIDLSGVLPTLPKEAQALVCEKSVIWVGKAGAPDIMHRGQYEALPDSAKKEWR